MHPNSRLARCGGVVKEQFFYATCSGDHRYVWLPVVLWATRSRGRKRVAGECGRKGGTSTIEAINYPGPLWSCLCRAPLQADTQRGRRRGGRREGAGWPQGEKGGEYGWGSAFKSVPAASAGLGSSAAVPGLVLRLLPDPGS